MGVNITDKKVWIGNASSTPIQLIGAGASMSLTSLTTSSDASVNYLTVGQGNTSGANNTAFGYQTLLVNTGTSNTSIGFQPLVSNTSGSYNTAVGQQSLKSNTTASYNTAVGYQAGYANTTGAPIDAFGYATLNANTTGGNNAAFGAQAMQSNTTGGSNTAIGRLALQANTTASNNTAVGYQAGYSNTTGQYGTFLGQQAGYTNSLGSYNTFIGYLAGYTSNYNGNAYNTCLGYVSGQNLTTGTINTFLGAGAGQNITTGSKNSIIGNYSGNSSGLDIRTASNYIVLSDGDGNPRGIFDGSGRFMVGATSSSDGIQSYGNFGSSGTGYAYGNRSTSSSGANAYFHQFVVAAGGAPSQVGSISYNGTLTVYATTSDQRLKENIVDAPSAINYIDSVKIRSFDWIDTKKTVTYGVIAQELNTVAPEGVIQGITESDMWSVDTSVLVPALIKAVQELSAKVTALEAKLGA